MRFHASSVLWAFCFPRVWCVSLVHGVPSFHIFNISESRMSYCVAGQMDVEMCFHRQNIQPSIDIVEQVSVTGRKSESSGVLLASQKPVGEEQFGKGSRLTHPEPTPGACRELMVQSWELFMDSL